MNIIQERIKSIVDSEKRFTGYGLVLKQLEKDNLRTICKWRNNETILNYMDYNIKTNVLSLTLWLKKIRTDYSWLPFIVRENNIDIGYLEFKNFDPCGAYCEQGVFLNPNNLEKGVGTRVYLLQEQVLQEMSINDIILSIRKFNERNLHIWQKLGAVIESQDEEFYYLKSKHKIRYEKLNIIAHERGYGKEWTIFLQTMSNK